MKTRTVLLTAALSVAGVASTMAQVYSVNAVGYVNQTYNAGFTMIANPLDAGEGNNTVGKLLPAVPDGSILYKYTGTGYDINPFDIDAWTNPDMTLAPGEGAFLRIPPGASAQVTYVGEVMQGALVNPVPEGFSIKSSMVPQAAPISADANTPQGTVTLEFPAADGDVIYRWSNAETKYNIFAFDIDAWSPSNPVINVGEAVFVRKIAAGSWDRTFSVNQ